MDRTWYQSLQVLEDDLSPLDPGARLAAMNGPLLDWYDHHARILPWREDPEPYRVWISEIMLQQTRVEAVKPYFERFMNALPDIEALAAVPEDRLMKLWEGLGYYNRARNLQKAAGIIVENYGGQMPSEYEALLALPGIGSYTAGAIASIAFGKPVPAVDGNVLRVISRVLASRRDILKQSTKKWMEVQLVSTMPRLQASHFNQGLIEIGAIVCIPNGQPKCPQCPLESLCLARKEGLLEEIPVKTKPKKRKIENRTVCIIEYGNQVGLRKRPDTGLLASLYELPNTVGHLAPEELAPAFGLNPADVVRVEALPEARHIFSHVEWHMIGYRIQVDKSLPSGCLTVEKEQIKAQYALPNAFGRYTKLIK
ncbi:MAG: A/G-specific adenine glycosylase [Lachnospiraceae bacterium]